MKRNLILLFTLLSWSLMAQITTNDVTMPGDCDGSAWIDYAPDYTDWSWYDSVGGYIGNADTLVDLCEGNYSIILQDTTGNFDTLTFAIGASGSPDPCENFSVNVNTVNASSDVDCDGQATAMVNNGSGMQYFWWSNQQNGSQADSLCAGTYTLIVDDTLGCVDTVVFTIMADSTTMDPCENFDVFVQTDDVTIADSCNGYALIVVSGSDQTVFYSWSSGGYNDVAYDLCEGSYTVNVYDSNGCQDVVTFYIGDVSDSTASNMWLNVNSMDVTNDCNGTAQVDVYGGTPPYTYAYSNGDNTLVADSLCEGFYTVVVTDANGNSSSTTFYIEDDADVIDATNYTDSTIVDTFFTNVNIDCDIDYNNISDVVIADYEVLGDSIQVVWHVYMNNGDTVVVITDLNFVQDPQGVYSFVLSVFCPNKAVSNALKAYDNIYIGNGTALVSKLDLEFGLFPNPVSGAFSISGEFQNANVQIINLSGKIIQTEVNVQPMQLINTQALSNGIYLLKVEADGAISTTKLIKK